MRSALVTALVFLSGCNHANQSDEKTENLLETVISADASPSPTEAVAPANAGSSGHTVEIVARDITGFEFFATGTEPFWSIDAGPGKIRYRNPENQAGTTVSAVVSPDGGGMRYSAKIDDELVVLVIQPGRCSDGMSDRVYELTARLTFGSEQLKGCATRF